MGQPKRPIRAYDPGGAGEARTVEMKLTLSTTERERFGANAARHGVGLAVYARMLLYQDDAGELLPVNEAVRSALRILGEAVGGAAATYAAQAEQYIVTRAEVPYKDRRPAGAKPWSS